MMHRQAREGADVSRQQRKYQQQYCEPQFKRKQFKPQCKQLKFITQLKQLFKQQ